jgi:hypothetical protein
LQAFRVGINTAKFRSRESKDDPIEILSPVTKDDILREVYQSSFLISVSLQNAVK